MERAISEMEKIRRAEEIYSRRKNGNSDSYYKEESLHSKSLYKICFQILVLFNIAIAIVAVQNKNYIFTADFLNQVNKYNIDIKNRVNELFTYTNKDENVVTENESETEDLPATDNGAVQSSMSQMELDIKTIKEKYSLILPVEGTKTSGFGTRDSSNEIVTKYHTGIDIANSKGTKIKSAIAGTVTQVSSEGDYGNHLRIASDELVTLYAHCNSIYVKEGDTVNQGQDIAEIGSTGNSTGNHLHFEIRYENRFINPELLIEI